MPYFLLNASGAVVGHRRNEWVAAQDMPIGGSVEYHTIGWKGPTPEKRRVILIKLPRPARMSSKPVTMVELDEAEPPAKALALPPEKSCLKLSREAEDDRIDRKTWATHWLWLCVRNLLASTRTLTQGEARVEPSRIQGAA